MVDAYSKNPFGRYSQGPTDAPIETTTKKSGFFVRVASASNLFKKRPVSLQLSSPIHFGSANSSPITSPSPLRKLLESRNPPASKAVALLKPSSGSGTFIQFNKVADKLKQQPDWKEKIATEVAKLPIEAKMQFASLDEFQLRGYDKEVAHAILSSLKLSSQADLVKSIAPKVITNAALTKLGGGAVNTVFKVTYKDSSGKSIEGVFKPDPSGMSAGTKIKEQHFGTAAASGIPPGDDAHLASRAVASSLVDSLLYGKETISVKTEFVTINGQRGILMEKAQGSTPKITGFLQKELKPDQYKHLLDGPEKPTPRQLKYIATELKLREVVVETDESGKWKLIGTSATFENLNPKNATTAEGLLKLQIKDWITGECDRHPENYFIDDDGKVTGIDEDCSFGVNAVPEDVDDVRSQSALKGFIPNNASLMLRLPPVITADIKAAVNNLYQNKDELRTTLKAHISEKEIDATISRLEKLHKHINNEFDCRVVNSSEELLSPDAQKSVDTNNSYWARELVVYSQDEKGWNHLRAHREM